MGRRILVVDDDEIIRYMYQEHFEKAGYTVLTTPDAETAEDLLRSEDISVMFLDLRLPGLSGVDLCRRIRRDNPIAIIYAVTGYTSIFELAACREAGFDDYFIKPVDVPLLLKAAADGFDRLDRWISP